MSLSVNIAGITFPNPVIAASGTYGYGGEYESLYPMARLGGIASKGITLEPRNGNQPPRTAETPSGLLNSVGLQNPGADVMINEVFPRLRKKANVIIANIAGSTVDDYIKLASKIDKADIDMIEVNISCPNVKQGGAAFGTSCDNAADVTSAVKKVTTKPVIVKLSPNVTDISEIAKAVESAGADCISLINTLLGMRIDINSKRPVLRNNVGGLSGAAVFPVAVRMVWQVSNAVKIPVIGLGGISTWKDAVEMMMAGATAIQIGSAMFSNPYSPIEVIEGIEQYMSVNNIKSLNEIIGAVKPW